MKRITLLCAAALLSVGCATGVGTLQKSSNYALGNEEVTLIIGLAPSNLHVALHSGTVIDGRFEIPTGAKIVSAGQGDDGYLVVKAKPGETLAVSSVLRKPTASQLVGQHKIFCGGELVYVFQAPKFGVAYVADFRLIQANGTLQIDPSINIAAAKNFANTQMHQPAIQAVSIKSVPSGAYCASPIKSRF